VLYLLDIFGTLIFAISGAFKASQKELDVLGALILAVATGVGGGIVRDVLLGATPPAAFQDELYFIVCLCGGTLVIFIAPYIARQWNMVMAADALGLGVFAAIGAAKASHFGLGPMGIIFMASMTAVGGGVIRDVLANDVPAIVHTDFYATAAIIGGSLFAILYVFNIPEPVLLLVTIVSTTGIRLVAMHWKLSLPRVRRLKK